jgi:hypothetical protein
MRGRLDVRATGFTVPTPSQGAPVFVGSIHVSRSSAATLITNTFAFPGGIEFFRKHLVEHLVLVPSAPSR